MCKEFLMKNLPPTMTRSLGLWLVCSLSFSSCTTPNGQPATKTYATGAILGGVLGAALGAGIGGLTGGSDGVATGAIAGAVIGTAGGLAAAHQKAVQRDHYGTQFATVENELQEARDTLGNARRSRMDLQAQLASANVSRDALAESLATAQHALEQLRANSVGLVQYRNVSTNTQEATSRQRDVNSTLNQFQREERELSETIRRVEKRLME